MTIDATSGSRTGPGDNPEDLEPPHIGGSLDDIVARCDAATPGPWIAASNNGRKDGIALVGALADRGTGQAIAVLAGMHVRQRHADAQFIAYAREDVPRLVGEIRRLRDALAAARTSRDRKPPRRHAICAAIHRPDTRMKGFYVCELEPGHDQDHLSLNTGVSWPRPAAEPCTPRTADGASDG